MKRGIAIIEAMLGVDRYGEACEKWAYKTPTVMAHVVGWEKEPTYDRGAVARALDAQLREAYYTFRRQIYRMTF